MEQMYDVGPPPFSISWSLPTNQAGSVENLPYLKDGIKNHLHRYTKKQAKDGYSDVVLAYL